MTKNYARAVLTLRGGMPWVLDQRHHDHQTSPNSRSSVGGVHVEQHVGDPCHWLHPQAEEALQ